MLRIKNEDRWIAEVIESILPLCGQVVILDDHSTDDTVEICRSYTQVDLYRSPFDGINETRDKNWLLDRVLEYQPEWILCIDGDEVLEQNGPAIIRESAESGAFPAYSLKVEYLWDTADRIRTDGIYHSFRRPSVFKLVDPSIRFKGTPYGGNFHCSNVPGELLGRSGQCPARLKHYGYIDAAMRIRKYEWYNRIDPNNKLEDCYRHMVKGDLPEIPANAELRYSTGPLTFAPWRE